MKRSTIRLLFFSKITFTKKFTKHSADLFHSRLFSQHSRLFSQQLFFKAQQYQTSPSSLLSFTASPQKNLNHIPVKFQSPSLSFVICRLLQKLDLFKSAITVESLHHPLHIPFQQSPQAHSH